MSTTSTTHLAVLADHGSRLKQQIGWDLSPNEGTALLIILAALLIIFGPGLIRKALS